MFRFLVIIRNVIRDNLKQIIDYAADYIEDSTDDWFRVKAEIARLFPPKDRSLFARRHFSTKKHTINDFERKVMAYWLKKTGVKLEIDESKLHDPNWIQRPKGWGLKEYNEKRRKQKEADTAN